MACYGDSFTFLFYFSEYLNIELQCAIIVLTINVQSGGEFNGKRTKRQLGTAPSESTKKISLNGQLSARMIHIAQGNDSQTS
jgi:hypothetical protein